MSSAPAPFQFNVPFDVFKSEDDGRMLFGGFVSSQKKDREDETIIQKGLNFAPWVERGWFNDNHDQKLVSGGGVVGVPVEKDPVKWLSKGDSNPLSGDPVERQGWFVQGELLDTPGGKSIFDISKALQKTSSSRRLGMSLEGNVVRRNGKSVLKADVHNIAITHRPVSHDTVVEVLTKALDASDALEDAPPTDPIPMLEELVKKVTALEDMIKALTAGDDIDNPGPIVRVDGGYIVIKKALAAGESVDAPSAFSPGDGFAFRKEDLDPKLRRITAPRLDDKDKKKGAKKSIDFKRALETVQTRLGLNDRDAVRVTERIFKQLHHQGRQA